MTFLRSILLVAIAILVCFGCTERRHAQRTTKSAKPPRKIYAHYMGCFHVASGPIGFWRGKVGGIRHDSSDRLAAMGGQYRNWYLVPQGMKLSAGGSADLDIRRALRGGIDGFAIDAWAGHQAKEVLAALFKVAEEKDYPFEITICLDPNCHGEYTRGKDPKGLLAGYTDSIRYLLERHGDSPKLARRDGKPLIFGYHSRGLGRTSRPKDALASPENWQDLIGLYDQLEKNVGQPLYLHFGMGAFFHGCDLAKLPGTRPPHQPGEWMVKASSAMSRHFPAVGAFIDYLFVPELDAMAEAVKTQGAEWSQPLWHQYENIQHQAHIWKGTDLLRDRWRRARETDSTLIQYVTWNDYGENTILAPGYQTRYTILDLNAYFIEWWKTGRPPRPEHDRLYLISRKYPEDARTFPFRSRRYKESVLEVITILPMSAEIRLPGRDVSYRAPKGFFVKQIPLTPGAGVGEIVRRGETVLRLEHPEPVTSRPFREDNGMTCISTEFERHWQADFAASAPQLFSETGDDDSDGLPNWFEMYWFGKFLDWQTATAAKPDADPDNDGKSNLEEFLAQSDPTTPPPVYRPGDVWDMRRIYERKVSYNPDPDFNGTPVWHYLYKIGQPQIAHDGRYEMCPKAGLHAAYAGHYVHHSPYPGAVKGFGNAYGWICRTRPDKDAPWQLVLRSPSQCMLILSWESPINGTIRIDARATAAEKNGATAAERPGATLTIEHSRPFRRLLRRPFKRAESSTIELKTIEVRKGDRLFFAAESPAGSDAAALRFDFLKITLETLAE